MNTLNDTAFRLKVQIATYKKSLETDDLTEDQANYIQEKIDKCQVELDRCKNELLK